MKKIYRCPKCSEYTMKETCSKCKIKTVNPKPAKFSVLDKYGKYRRLAKKS